MVLAVTALFLISFKLVIARAIIQPPTFFYRFNYQTDLPGLPVPWP